MSLGATVREGLGASLPAAVLSGLPSTVHALFTGRDPLEATRAAGSILLQQEKRSIPLLAAAVPVHLAISAGWAVILAATLPRRSVVREGIVAGLVIAAIDLGVMGKRFPLIGSLAPFPQIADHLAFGLSVSVTLSRRKAARE